MSTASVLFADLVGSTSLGEQLDAEDYHEIAGGAVRAVVEAIEAEGGDVAELAGDGVLATFADPESAVAAASRATQAVGAHARSVAFDIAVRVGVATGPVRFIDIDAGGRRFTRVTGSTVDRAIALEASAKPGTFEIDSPTATAHSDGPMSGSAAGFNCATGAGMQRARDERRVILALYVGFRCRPGTDDPETTLAAAVPPVASIVSRFGGTLKDVAGGAVVALFGAPTAHEDDAERAVRAGLAALDAADRYGIDGRAGVAAGAVVVGEVGAGRHTEYGAVGDAMNTAARLHAAAPWGELLASAIAARRASGVAWGEPAAVTAKGKAEGVLACRALRTPVEEPPGDRDGNHQLVGRQAEQAALASIVARVRAGGSAVVLLAGPAGSGKSALAAWARVRSVDAGVPWLALRGVPWEADDDLRVASALLNVLGRTGADGSSLAEAVDATSLEVVDGLGALIRARGPAVLFVEDLHAVDLATAAVLAQVAERGIGGLLLIATTREDERVDSGLARLRDQAVVIDIAELPAGHDRALLESLTGEAVLPYDLEARVLETARGNPLFIRELVSALIDQGRLVLAPAGGWNYVAGPADLPDTVHRVVLARVDLLPALPRELLLAAVVLRANSPADVLAEVVASTGSSDEIHAALAQLETAGFLVSVAGQWGVGHLLVREALEASLVRRDRKTFHRRAAEALERRGLAAVAASALAWHWTEAGEPDRVVMPALLAAEYAARRFSYNEAAQFQALALDAVRAGAGGDYGSIAVHLGELLAAGGRLAEAMASFADAAAEDTDSVDVAVRSAVGYEDALFASRGARGGKDDQSLTLLDGAVALLDDEISSRAARVLAARARALAYRADPRAAGAAERAVATARRSGDDAAIAYALVAWRAAHEGPEWIQDRRRRAREMVRAARASGDDALHIEVQRLALMDDLQAGAPEAADEAILELSSLIAALKRHDQGWYPPMWEAMRALWRGDLHRADAAVTAFRSEARRVGYVAGEQVYAVQLFLLRRAQRRAEELVPLFARVGAQLGQPWQSFDLALSAAIGDVDRAGALVNDLDLSATLPNNLAFTGGAAAATQGLRFAAQHNASVHDRAHAIAARLYDRLLPWSGQMAIIGAGAASFGPVDLTLGRLARMIRGQDGAMTHLHAARTLATRVGAPLDLEAVEHELRGDPC